MSALLLLMKEKVESLYSITKKMMPQNLISTSYVIFQTTCYEKIDNTETCPLFMINNSSIFVNPIVDFMSSIFTIN